MLRKPSAKTASLGVTRVKLAIESELGWLFREQPTEDYGIDAQVEIVDGETVRGKLLAVQIKSGASMFREPTPGGWWFRPDSAHVRYWLGHSLQVAVILHHPVTHHCHWQLVNPSTLVSTSRGGWKLLIPETHVLDETAQAPLREAAEGYRSVVRIPESAGQASQPSSLASPQQAHGELLPTPIPEDGLDANFDATPHPRLLHLLGDLIISPWTCVAEIVDSAYCSMLDASPEPPKLTVTITLPEPAGELSNELIVHDNGVGLSAESLLVAIQASASGVVSKWSTGLLLMAMRFGRKLTIRTSRAGDSSWTELTYALLEDGAFAARIYRVAKEDPEDHGTEIAISDLLNDQRTLLASQCALIHEQLSECYSYLLREGKLAIILNEDPVLPRRPCIWDASRVVMWGRVPVSAVQEISLVLPSAWVCRSCGFRHTQRVDMCAICQGRDISELPRQICGWLGVQRYLHPSDFGLDFLRNGRKILRRDKRLFTWRADENSLPVTEYPVEMPIAGRIVGEVHCDHVPVNWTKDAFDYNSPDWHQVVRTIRGVGPLGPVRRKRLGYPANDSPLALLFSAFRRNDPGRRYLTPGNGQSALHDTARLWAARFHDGDPGFQTDQVWYEAVLSHERLAIQVRTIPPA